MQARIKALLVLLLALAVAGAIFYQLKNLSEYKNQSAVPAETQIPPITTDSSRSALLRDSKLVFPSTAGTQEYEQEGDISQLPESVAAFVVAEARDLSIEKSNTGGAAGFYIQYKVFNVPFIVLFDSFFNEARKSWNVLTASRANLFAFIDMENTVYQVRISQSLVDDKQIEVTIEVLDK